MGESLAKNELFLFFVRLLQRLTFEETDKKPSVDNVFHGITRIPKPFSVKLFSNWINIWQKNKYFVVLLLIYLIIIKILVYKIMDAIIEVQLITYNSTSSCWAPNGDWNLNYPSFSISTLSWFFRSFIIWHQYFCMKSSNTGDIFLVAIVAVISFLMLGSRSSVLVLQWTMRNPGRNWYFITFVK